ncbi:MAG TPA: hypothetical protein VFQ23_01655, partial [Anaerolineales bacterium]|nr:hypothetical protein [Anaerolineales bacterium]
MFRGKSTFPLVVLFAVFLSSCAPGAEFNPLPGMTRMPGTDIPQQVDISIPDILTQTAVPVTSTPVPDGASPTPSSTGLKPPDSDTPAAGICGDAQSDPVSIVLGMGPDGIPLAPRCIIITPGQRIKLI